MNKIMKILLCVLVLSFLFAGCSNTSTTEQRIKMGDYNGDGVVSEAEKNSLCYQSEIGGKRFVEEDGERYDPKEHFGNFETCYFYNIIEKLNENLSKIEETGSFEDCKTLPKEFIPYTTDENIIYYQADCLEYFVIKNKDSSLCNEVYRSSNMDRDLCLIEYAKKFSDSEICDLIELDSLKPVCQDNFN